uniref:Mqo protein n=1 Tax=Fopius arisanus TaxID=64838 RepID=A0A0C9QI67_9HYME
MSSHVEEFVLCEILENQLLPVLQQELSIQGIRQCVREALDLIPDFSTEEIPLAQLFVNTTACILAKTRCGALNPITGSAHEHLDISKLPIPSINAILINSNYDMNIVQLPFVQGAIDDCAKYRSVQQAPWPSVQC